MKIKKNEYIILAIPLLISSYFYIPLLAGGPLNPDAGELLLTAQNGGVLHPPGFPTQSWINLILNLLPFSVHTNLLMGNLIFQILNNYLLYLILKKLNLSTISIGSSLITFSLLPVTWSLSIQVEKYILLVTLLLIPILIWLNWLETKSSQNVYLFAFFWSLALGHHHFAIILTPFSIQFLFSKENKFNEKLIALNILFIITISLFLSMLLLTKQGVLPDWGKLQSISDVLNHILRKGVSIDHKMFGFIHETNISAFHFFLESLKEYFYLPLIISLFGLRFFNRANFKYLPLLISFLLSIGILFLFNYQPDNVNFYWATYLRRYSIIVIPFFIEK